MPEAGGIPVSSGPAGLSARPDQAICDLATAEERFRLGRIAGPARICTTSTARTATGPVAGISLVATMTGAGFRRAIVPVARPGRLRRRRQVPGLPSQRSEQSFRQRGPRPGGPGRRVRRRLVARRVASRGKTRTDVRAGCPVTGTPMRGAMPAGVRHGASGRVGRQHHCTAKGRARITNQAREQMPARGRREPTGRRDRAEASQGSGRHLR